MIGSKGNIIIRGMIDRFGHNAQSVVAIEEMSELTKELTKAIRGMPNHDNLVEETADVLICLTQVCEMYNIKEDELYNMIEVKLIRMDSILRKEE